MLDQIAKDIDNAKIAKQKTVMIHFLVLLNAEFLKEIAPEEFCKTVGIEPIWAKEFTKMIRLSEFMKEKGFSIKQRQ